MSASQKKKRRSSLAPGRLHVTPRADREKDLYREIDKSLPNEERLAVFTQSCFKYTLEKMEEEVDDPKIYDNFKAEAERSITQIINDMKENHSFHEACTKSSCLPNPINAEMDDAIVEIETMADKLNSESDQWNSMVSEMEKRLENTKQLGEMRKLAEDDVPEHVKVQAKMYMIDSLNYNGILAEMNRDMAEAATLTMKLANSIYLLKTVHEKASHIIDHRYKDLCEDLAIDTVSPKSLIEAHS